MIERLRALAEEPFDPEVVRTVVAVAGSILIGLAALFLLALGVPDPGTKSRGEVAPAESGTVRVQPPSADYPHGERPALRPPRRQDPQDVAGSAAARRASHALRSVRALQHVPYRDGTVAITLAGARGSRAVLRVTAPTISAARRGWRRFLRRYRDSGRAYFPLFEAGRGPDA